MEKSRVRQIGYWTLVIILMLLFTSGGVLKLSGAQAVKDNFARWGYDDWFRPVVGTIEAVFGLLLLFRSTVKIGILFLSCTMVGAVITHIRIGELSMVPVPTTLLLLLLLLFYLVRKQENQMV